MQTRKHDSGSSMYLYLFYSKFHRCFVHVFSYRRQRTPQWIYFETKNVFVLLGVCPLFRAAIVNKSWSYLKSGCVKFWCYFCHLFNSQLCFNKTLIEDITSTRVIGAVCIQPHVDSMCTRNIWQPTWRNSFLNTWRFCFRFVINTQVSNLPDSIAISVNTSVHSPLWTELYLWYRGIEIS